MRRSQGKLGSHRADSYQHTWLKGLSWVLLWLLARQDILGPSMRAFAWVHLVALGWLSLIALSVLLFVVPQFTGVSWIGESWARNGLIVFAAGAYAMVIGFWIFGLNWVWLGSLLVLFGLSTYVVAAVTTLSVTLLKTGTDAAIARAFVVVLLFLLMAAFLGMVMAHALAFGPSSVLATLPPAHASLAAIGWLTLLVMGVSARTVGPITGHRSPRRWVHIMSSSLVMVGAVALGTASWLGPFFQWLGTAACVVGLLMYSVDMLALVLTASVPHRPPQAFVAASVIWLLVACVLGLDRLNGNLAAAQACVFVGLVGWIGQMVIAHLHHIGIRLIATMLRGDDDETPPQVLLNSNLSWSSFILFQLAVGCGGIALLLDSAHILATAALSGGLGWLTMTANVIRAVFAARSPVVETAS